MEENLRKLLTDLIKQETERKNAQEEIIAKIEREKGMLSIKEQTEIERFTEGMKEDIEAGMYNNRTENEMQRVIIETKNSIMERYNREREKLARRLEEVNKEQEKDKEKIYKQINSGIKEYHTDMVLESTKAQRELAKMKSEREDALEEIKQKIDETESKRTHMIIRNRNFIDVEGSQISADIRALGIELEQLKAKKDELSSEFDEKIETQSQYVQQCIEKKDRMARVIGGITLSDKSLEEIHQMLFGDAEIESEEVVVEEKQQPEQVVEEPEVEVVEEEQQPEEIIEEPVVEEVEEEQQPEQVIEEPKVEPVVIVQPASEVEEEQPVEVVEEKKPEEVVQEKETVQVVEKVQPANGVKINNLQNQEKQPSRQPVIKQTKAPDQDRNYKYFENNKDIIIKYFMKATGIKKNEATEIFSNKEHCEAVGEMCRMWMHQQNRDNNELYKKMENFYWGIDSKLDIEVSNNGIKYNQELMSPIEITDFEEYEEEFIEEIINKYEQDLSGYKYASKDIVYDRNIIIAIAMDNCKEDADGKLQLTTSGMKKMAEYLDLIVNPVNKKGSVTYNLEKMSMFRGLINISSWTPKKVGEFRKIAYQAKDTYAQIIPDRITKMKWAIKDWFKGVTTKKLTKGEQTVSKAETVKENEEKRNKWELPFEQKAYANSRTEKTQNVEQPKSEKSAENEIQI